MTATLIAITHPLCPTGDSPRSSPSGKNNSLFRNSDLSYKRITPAHERGGSRSSRNAGRDAVDAGGVGARRNRRAGRTVSDGHRADERRRRVRQKRVVLAVVATVKLSRRCVSPTGSGCIVNPPGDGGKTNSSPGRACHKPSNHCAGKAGRFRLHLCFLCASLRIRSAQRPWVPAGTRSSLRPLSGKGVRRQAKLGQNMPREC